MYSVYLPNATANTYIFYAFFQMHDVPSHFYFGVMPIKYLPYSKLLNILSDKFCNTVSKLGI